MADTINTSDISCEVDISDNVVDVSDNVVDISDNPVESEPSTPHPPSGESSEDGGGSGCCGWFRKRFRCLRKKRY